MSLSDTRKDFIAGKTARGLAGRKLFVEKTPDALRSAVFAALSAEAEKERTLDDEARRMMEGPGRRSPPAEWTGTSSSAASAASSPNSGG